MKGHIDTCIALATACPEMLFVKRKLSSFDDAVPYTPRGWTNRSRLTDGVIRDELEGLEQKYAELGYLKKAEEIERRNQFVVEDSDDDDDS